MTGRIIHIHSRSECVTSAILAPITSSLFFFSLLIPPSFPSFYAYHSIALSTASVVAATQGKPLLLLAHAISLAAALMPSAPLSQRGEKTHGDGLGDRLITAPPLRSFSPPYIPLSPDRSQLHFYLASVFLLFQTYGCFFFFLLSPTPNLLS